jgi:hypothetical protein
VRISTTLHEPIFFRANTLRGSAILKQVMHDA